MSKWNSRYDCKDFNGNEFKKDMLLNMIEKKERINIDDILVIHIFVIEIFIFGISLIVKAIYTLKRIFKKDKGL